MGVNLCLQFSLTRKSIDNFFFQLNCLIEKLPKSGLVGVKERSEDRIAGCCFELSEPLPKLLCLLSPEKLRVLFFVYFLDDLEVFFLKISKAVFLSEMFPSILKLLHKLIFDLVDIHEERLLFVEPFP